MPHTEYVDFLYSGVLCFVFGILIGVVLLPYIKKLLPYINRVYNVLRYFYLKKDSEKGIKVKEKIITTYITIAAILVAVRPVDINPLDSVMVYCFFTFSIAFIVFIHLKTFIGIQFSIGMLVGYSLSYLLVTRLDPDKSLFMITPLSFLIMFSLFNPYYAPIEDDHDNVIEDDYEMY
jgi:hypothetical protein